MKWAGLEAPKCAAVHQRVKQKLEIIDLVEKARPGKTKKEIAAELSIPPSTLSTILKNKATLRNSHAFGSAKKM